MAASDGHQEVVDRYNVELLRTIRERALPRAGVAGRGTAEAVDGTRPGGAPMVVSAGEGRGARSPHEMRTP